MTLGLLAGSPAPAEHIALEACARRTVLVGGEAGHRDMGQGRVAWRDWWSEEAAFDDLRILDCATGEGLTARVRQEGAIAGLPFDRRPAAERILEREARAPHFYSPDRIAAALAEARIAAEPWTWTADEEPCACAALYPDAWQKGTLQ